MYKEGTTLYDDFVFGHSKTGSYSHYAASFLPWHRMYIHVFERALRYHCGYSGSLPYVRAPLPGIFKSLARICRRSWPLLILHLQILGLDTRLSLPLGLSDLGPTNRLWR